GVGDFGTGRARLGASSASGATGEAAIVPVGGGSRPRAVRHVDGNAQALAASGDRAVARGVRNVEPVVSADLAPVRRIAGADGAAAFAVLGDGRVAVGDPANRPRWLGQLQLRGGALHRLSGLSRAMAAAR